MKSNNMLKPKVIIHCQYVYGIGHLVRTSELAKGLTENFDVYVFNGGETVPNFKFSESIKFIQLPAIYKEETRNELIPVDKSQTLSDCFDERRSILDKWINKIVPDIIITEHFPFGLLFEKEVLHILDIALKINPNIKNVCSVRDIIESSNGGLKDNYTCTLINKYYDLVLVHGDGAFASLSTSFPRINGINIPVVQTGYIVRPIPIKNNENSIPTILTSVAGGRIGTELLDAMIESHLMVKDKKEHRLVLFSGAFQKDFSILKEKVSALKSDSIVINKFDSRKYLKYLSNASLIISLGGYNSLIESVSIKKTLLIYNRKFAGSNKEQDLRIKLFEKHGLLKVISSDDLQKEKLTRLILEKFEPHEAPKIEVATNGVQNSRKQLLKLLKNI